jgi:Holliday junction resolvase RusA-like endonuclease
MHFPTAKAKAFRKEVWGIVKQQRMAVRTERLKVTLTLYPPTHAARDIDNYVKPALDAMQLAGCFGDDEQIDELHVVRGSVMPGGAVRVLIQAHTVQPPQQPALELSQPLTAKQIRDAEIESRVPW